MVCVEIMKVGWLSMLGACGMRASALARAQTVIHIIVHKEPLPQLVRAWIVYHSDMARGCST